MPLPDFTDFPPLLALRQKMGATELGSYDFFDPARHLTGDERVALAGQGLAVARAALRRLIDHTVGFKNARVLVWGDEGGDYHLSWCSKFPTQTALWVGASKPAAMRVCSACLDQLQYEGHSSHRSRHQAYYEQVRAEFNVGAFFTRYPHYPVT